MTALHASARLSAGKQASEETRVRVCIRADSQGAWTEDRGKMENDSRSQASAACLRASKGLNTRWRFTTAHSLLLAQRERLLSSIHSLIDTLADSCTSRAAPVAVGEPHSHIPSQSWCGITTSSHVGVKEREREKEKRLAMEWESGDHIRVKPLLLSGSCLRSLQHSPKREGEGIGFCISFLLVLSFFCIHTHTLTLTHNPLTPPFAH